MATNHTNEAGNMQDNQLDSTGMMSPELKERTSKQLLWIFIFAVVMIFAGLTSGYIVSQGGRFWVSIKLPTAFVYSTIAILASSLCLILARQAVKKANYTLTKLMLGGAFVLGILFAVFQFFGWKNLWEDGNAFRGPILNSTGKYGKYFSVLYQGKEVIFDNGTYYSGGEPLSPTACAELKQFGGELAKGARTSDNTYHLTNYGTTFSLVSNNSLVSYLDNHLMANGAPLSQVQHSRLYYFGYSLKEGLGDFVMKGVYGEDFVIYYQGSPLEYKARNFYLNGKPLSAKKFNDLNNQQNISSSYIYAMTGIHLLHWVGGIIALLVMFIKALSLRYTSTNYLGIKTGSIYWHFLGILWIYLYAFLIFIH